MNQKQVTIKLFYNQSAHQYYVQLGDGLLMITERIARIISEREGLEIRTGADLKAVQIMSIEDDKKEK